MSIADLFETGERKQHKSHFKNLVMIAKADGNISEEETLLLGKIAKYIGLSEDQANDILKNPEQYSDYPSASKEERYSRLIYLVEMVNADSVFETSELSVLSKCGVALGFSEGEIVDVIDAVINGLEEGKNHDQILNTLI